MFWPALAGGCIDAGDVDNLAVFTELPFTSANREAFEGGEDSSMMVVATNDVDIILWIVGGNSEVLPRCDHFTSVGDLAFVVDHVATIACGRLVAFKATYQEELVVWNVDALEVVWNLILGNVLLVIQLQFLELSRLFDVVECLQLVRVEGNQWHREVRVVCDFTNLVNCVNFRRQTAEVGELELRHCEEVGGFLHGPLKCLEFFPEIVELAPIGHEVHLRIEVTEEVVKFLREVSQVF